MEPITYGPAFNIKTPDGWIVCAPYGPGYRLWLGLLWRMITQDEYAALRAALAMGNAESAGALAASMVLSNTAA